MVVMMTGLNLKSHPQIASVNDGCWKKHIKEVWVNNLHLFCPKCKEADCLCSNDGTCKALRDKLDGKNEQN